jgi:hypothetical protein
MILTIVSPRTHTMWHIIRIKTFRMKYHWFVIIKVRPRLSQLFQFWWRITGPSCWQNKNLISSWSWIIGWGCTATYPSGRMMNGGSGWRHPLTHLTNTRQHTPTHCSAFLPLPTNFSWFEPIIRLPLWSLWHYLNLTKPTSSEVLVLGNSDERERARARERVRCKTWKKKDFLEFKKACCRYIVWREWDR